MSREKPKLLILGSSSFLTKPLIECLLIKNEFKIICQSRNKLKVYSAEKFKDIDFIQVDFSNKKYNEKDFYKCLYVINFINSSLMKENELYNYREFIKYLSKTSLVNLIHISTSSVYGNCKNEIISELSKCHPKNRYQKTKLQDEYIIQKIATTFKRKLYILRPTEIIGFQSVNAKKFIRSYFTSSFIKRYLIKSLYRKRISHFVSSKFVINNILKILEGKVYPGIYLVSQDQIPLNNFYEICKILDSIIYKKSKGETNDQYTLPLTWLFKIIYSICRPNQTPPCSKFISKKPIINSKNYLNLKKDLLEHINFVLESKN